MLTMDQIHHIRELYYEQGYNYRLFNSFQKAFMTLDEKTQ